ncbi:TetR/AcrR family transcriptional regulator [Streptomyces corynorhini]|uniref:TetR/AcrR family transcriptional regulator n=1 Tax=Streptomyces corynorhini TaxID=2282652 RepID=A0A370BGG6_9ACTN|nr:TetR/AcrR family transcriptional regulator [Streptomyces corynorhini]RDG38766.1 TetR/AcrR family transcriptional regulator [Streptomyces corynorhini]
MTSERRRLQPRKEPRQARAELTRQRILTAAAHVFAEYGYAAGTTNRIAREARISIGSLYQYYPNKDAILAELLIRHLDSGMAGGPERTGGPFSGPLEDIIRGQVRAAIANHLDDPHLLRVMFEQAPRSPELIEKLSRHERARVASVRDLLATHPEARVDDPYTAARLTVSTVELAVHQLIAEPDPLDTAALERELVAMLTRYLTGGPERTAARPAPHSPPTPPATDPPTDPPPQDSRRRTDRAD